MVALLILGSAISLLSCKSTPKAQAYNPETMITMEGDTVTMSRRENGRLKFVMRTPLMESYGMAREPYDEYRKGIYVETYKDSVEVIQSTLRADYAIYNQKLQIWRVQGNVVGTGENNRTLYTEQLFWNEKTGRIYSNVTSTVIEGEDIFVGDRFESDEKFENWVFLNYTGKVTVEMEGEENTSAGVSGADADQRDTLSIKPAANPVQPLDPLPQRTETPVPLMQQKRLMSEEADTIPKK